MRKRILWLARTTGTSGGNLYRKRPKRVKNEAGGLCSCGRLTCKVDIRPEGVAYEGDVLISFCEDGLAGVGIKIPEGGLLKLEVNYTVASK